MVKGVRVLADIGSDHAYLPIALLQEKKIQRAIITDVAKGPIQSAKQTVEQSGLEEFCSVRMGDGLSPVKPGEASCLVIAGMGGILISEILQRGAEVARSAESLILQPMQHAVRLRDFLNTNYYKIVEERVVYDAGKYYEVIKVINGEQRRFNKIELEIGYAMVKNEVYFDFLNRKSEKMKQIIAFRRNSESRQNIEEYEEVLDGIRKEFLEKNHVRSGGIGQSGQKI